MKASDSIGMDDFKLPENMKTPITRRVVIPNMTPDDGQAFEAMAKRWGIKDEEVSL